MSVTVEGHKKYEINGRCEKKYDTRSRLRERLVNIRCMATSDRRLETGQVCR